MLKLMALCATALMLLIAAPSTPTPTAGSWQVDTHHSDVQLITDGTTDYGKKKMNFTWGYAKVHGAFRLDDADPTNSKIDFSFYPGNSQGSPITEDGKIQAAWLANAANNTLVCFHSKKVARTPDGKLQATGDLVLTRIDRNVDDTPSEAYAGPVYGPAMVHRVSREAIFVFDPPSPSGNQKNAVSKTVGSTSLSRENFPGLLRAVIGTHWPTLVQDEQCWNPAGGTEDYRGFQCTGTFLKPADLPSATQAGENNPGAWDLNAVVGNQLTIFVHLHLMPQGTTEGEPHGM
jgi:polyisoprenoid-binding protein YceI